MVKSKMFSSKNKEVKILKNDQKAKIVSSIIVLMCLIGFTVLTKYCYEKKESLTNDQLLLADNLIDSSTAPLISETNMNENETQPEISEPEIVYDGLTLDELSDKLNRSLNSTISGYGKLFASKSIELGLDPYLAVAIVLHETGCSWNCSELVNQCYNVGGQKGGPGCWGGSYRAFSSMEEGINSFLENLYYNYYAIGLTTPETINPKYAESTAWASKINAYIEKIKAA